MTIIHIESGLGNQMLSYCEYLALKYVNPDEDFYLETIIFDISDCNELICQWNGYELERIFGINTPPNIKSLFSDEEWAKIMQEIRSTEFWNHNWNYPVSFTEVFNKHGLHLKNIRGDFDPNHNIIGTGFQQKTSWKDNLKQSYLYKTAQRYVFKLFEQHYVARRDNRHNLFLKTNNDIFTGQWLSFKLRGNDRELIDNQILDDFVFPDFVDDKNIRMASFLENCNSVAIHARRGDMLSGIAWCYKYGYFKRAVKHIRKHVENPVFVFFTNPGSIDWCKENADVFGLDFSKDEVCFVDWNKGEDSYRDIQLMSYCKHAIITSSSFGWWGAYFIKNPHKITISPEIDIDTTYHC